MKYYRGVVSKEWFWYVGIIFTGLIVGLSVQFSFTPPYSLSDEEKEETETMNIALANEVEDLNAVLPQRIATDTYFDSVGAGTNKLHYYYSVSNLTKKNFIESNLYDSLYNEAVNRIPCTLWRPIYMQGVEVSFTYYASDGAQLLHFARQQENCSQ